LFNNAQKFVQSAREKVAQQEANRDTQPIKVRAMR
jgi:hypothetical protein